MELDEAGDDIPMRRTSRRTRSTSSPIASSPPRSSPKTKRGRGRPPKIKPDAEEDLVDEAIEMDTNGIDSIDFEALKQEETFSYSANTTLDVGELVNQIEQTNQQNHENNLVDDNNSELRRIEKEEGLSTPIPAAVPETGEVSSKISSTINSNSNHEIQAEETESPSTAINVEHLSLLIESTTESLKRKLEGTDVEVEEVKQASVDVADEGPSEAKKSLLDINIRKLLPDLEKHWETVEKDPTDFTSWTYLLQYVDQENELLATREAYDKFLARYPYCYGYWKKYADYEKRKGSAADCEEVFRRGLKAIPLSVDLWIHYLNYTKAAREGQTEFIRCQFEASLEACGMEFRSDKLWEHYIHWEKEGFNWRNVLKLYDRVISMPTQNYQSHFQNLNDFVKEYNPMDMLSDEEYLEFKNSLSKAENAEDELTQMRDKILERRAEMHQRNEEQVKARWEYEEAIKRPYFHVKALEKGQLKMWKEYLEFEIEKGDYKRIITLFERCLIACALYEEYWIKYAKFLQSQKELDIDSIRYVYARGCEIHHKGKLWINLHRAAFEEHIGNLDRSLEILENIEQVLPDSLHLKYRRINFERRRENLQKCEELFQKYITTCKNSVTSVHLTIKYARFLAQRMNMYEKATKLLEDTVDLDEHNRAKVIMALVDLGLQRNPVDDEMIVRTFNRALSGTLTDEQKITIAHRKVEFLEDYGNDISSLEIAHAELQRIAKEVRESKKETDKKPEEGNIPKMDVSSNSTSVTTVNGTDNTYQTTYNASIYGQQYDQFGQYSNWSSGGGYTEAHGWSAYQGYYA